MGYFQDKGCKYFAIEPIEKLSSSIQKRGGTVIGESINDNLQKYEGYFDIILFRHILEHMLNPTVALSTLKCLLSLKGLIYLALPNAATPNVKKKGFATSFLRPVHISYFCKENVLRLTQSVGLRTISEESNGEILYVLKHKADKSVSISNSYYNQQKKVFLTKKKESFFKDSKVILNGVPRTLIKRFMCLMKYQRNV